MKLPPFDEFIDKLKHFDRKMLSKAFTLNESTLEIHNDLFDSILNALKPVEDQSLVIGITGIPGVGKSTFIESFGSYLHQLGKKIAVFAIDPSSQNTQGSILGDKTRMEQLSRLPNVFIRPSPSSNQLGGLGLNTHKNIALTKAIGFDIILVETVGVGQSETMVKELCDLFLLLMMPGSGDELQGVKKGIMEMANLLIVHKADGELIEAAEKSKKELEAALHYTRDHSDENAVFLYSSLTQKNADAIWNWMERWILNRKKNLDFYKNRKKQDEFWFDYEWKQLLIKHISKTHRDTLNDLQSEITKGNFISRKQIVDRILYQSYL
jgi:LAO/AO transport system kinase